MEWIGTDTRGIRWRYEYLDEERRTIIYENGYKSSMSICRLREVLNGKRTITSNIRASEFVGKKYKSVDNEEVTILSVIREAGSYKCSKVLIEFEDGTKFD